MLWCFLWMLQNGLVLGDLTPLIPTERGKVTREEERDCAAVEGAEYEMEVVA